MEAKFSLDVWWELIGFVDCNDVEDTDGMQVTEAKLVSEVGLGARLVGTNPVAVGMKVT